MQTLVVGFLFYLVVLLAIGAVVALVAVLVRHRRVRP